MLTSRKSHLKGSLTLINWRQDAACMVSPASSHPVSLPRSSGCALSTKETSGLTLGSTGPKGEAQGGTFLSLSYLQLLKTSIQRKAGAAVGLY